MTTVTVYRSSDASAPSLTGQAGGLITVLDACLVNGYGSQANAGWTKSFSGTNKAAYRNSATDGTGFYLHIDDTGTNNTAKEALMTGFETMSVIDTGTGQFPTAAQVNLFAGSVTGGVVCRKSTTADSTVRNWTLVADDTVFYFFAETGDVTNPVAAYSFSFGDIFSYKSSDAYRCHINGRAQANNSNTTNDVWGTVVNPSSGTSLATQQAGHYMPRTWTAVGGSIQVGKHSDAFKLGVGTNNSSYGYGAAVTYLPYPNGPDGGLYLAPVWIHHTNAVRGYFKGLWCPCHYLPLNHNDTYSGTGNLAGKSFVVQNIISSSPGSNLVVGGQVHIETSSTWS